ncbi:hypothetical protein [Shewanella sp.]|uniref:hypothetical protein n=1 Tax=Shewanella sp. TaxID=50422 RepID=UPI003A975277
MYRYLLLLSSMLAITACSPAKEVTFDPSVGDEHTYWTYADIEVSGYGRQQQKSTQRQHFEVTDTSPLKIIATSDYVDIRAGGSHRLNSLAADSQDEKAMRLFSKGLELTIDTDSGKLQNLRALDDDVWQEILKKGGKEAIAEFTKGTLTPGVLKTIPATVGASVDLPEFAGQSVSVTVNKVTDDEVTTVIDGRDAQDQRNLYGVMVLARDDGWLKQLILVSKQQMERYGKKLEVRTRVAMLPGDQPAQFDFDGYGPFDDWQPIYGDDISEDMLVPPTGEAMLPYDHGIFHASNDGPELVLPHDGKPQQAIGRVKLEEIKAFDASQQPLDVDFQWVINSSYPDDMALRAQVVPLGWNKESELKRIDSFTATVDYYPVSYLTKKVQWQAGEQHININDATITIKPLADQADTYELTMDSSANTQLMLFMKGLKGEYKEWPEDNNDFLNYSEKLIFKWYSKVPTPERYLLKLSETPTEMTFYASQEASESTYSRKLTFITSEKYQQHPEYPPLFEDLLYGYGHDASEQQRQRFDELTPNTKNKQGSSISLPTDWDNSCQLRVLSGNEENGHKLTWLADNEQNSEPFSTLYQLSTDDGIRRYFYGISVTSELSCDGQPQWQALDFQPSDKPWLVSVAQLDGVDLQQTVAEFMAHYHLLNASGQPLKIMSADGKHSSQVADSKLADILTAQQQLRVVGKVASVQHLNVLGEPVKRQWTTTFPALP